MEEVKMNNSQEQMDVSVLNDTTNYNDTLSTNQNDTLSTTQNDTTLNTTVSHKPILRKSVKLPSNYFDIDDILSMNERVSCTFEQDLIKMGYLDPSTDNEHLVTGSKLELPIWLAQEFYNNKIKVLKVETPSGYNMKFREIFDADATIIDLNKICSNFYKFGEHVMSVVSKEEKDEIAFQLESAFKQRLEKILNHSLNAKSESVKEGVVFKKKLDREENRLYNLGKQQLDHYQKWEENQLHKINTNDLVENLKKRKKAACSAGLYTRS